MGSSVLEWSFPFEIIPSLLFTKKSRNLFSVFGKQCKACV